MIYFKGSWDDHLPLIDLPTIIVTVVVFRWPLMRYYMGVDIDIQFVGLEETEEAIIGPN